MRSWLLKYCLVPLKELVEFYEMKKVSDPFYLKTVITA
jgi:hypothetical protein